MNLRFNILLLIYINFLVGCDFEKMRSVTTIGETTIGVDEAVSPILKKESDEFMRLNKEAKVNHIIKTSNELIADLLNGDIKTIVVMRDFNDMENEFIRKYNISVKRYRFARDGIGIIVNPENPIKKLNYNELRRIFTGEIVDWKALDGESKDLHRGRIKLFIARRNSALHDYFKERVLKNNEFFKTSVPCSTSEHILNEVKNDKNAIGFISMAWITKFADTLVTIVKPLKVASVDSSGWIGEYVGLHQGYIATEEYPLIMDVHIFTTDYDMNVASGYISFLLSYDGQKVVLNSGLVPVTQPVRIIQLH